jgi:GNAT superfamily N-acetyltransferase
MNFNTEVKVLDLATFGDLSTSLQNFSVSGSDITARFLSFLEARVAEMEEVCSRLYTRMREAEDRLEEARNQQYAAQTALSYCESQVYTSSYYDDEGNCYEETIYPDCSSEWNHLSYCEELRYEALKIHEATEELHTEGRNLLLAARECISNLQANLKFNFHPLLNSHTPIACQKLSEIATNLYGYLDTRFSDQTPSSVTVTTPQQTFSQMSNSSDSTVVDLPAAKALLSKSVVLEENDHFSLSFKDKLGRNVLAKWTYKEDQLVAFDSLTCDGKNVMQYASPVQFTINLEKGYDFKNDVEIIKSRSMHLNSIYLLDEYQGSGIGGEIVRQLESLAEQKNCVQIDGIAKNNEAKAFFLKMGFDFEENSNSFKKILSTKPSNYEY